MAVGAPGGSHAVPQDPLAFLPRKPLIEYRRGQIIFDQGQPSDGLYLVVDGRVKVASAVEGGGFAVLDIYTDGDFFGESGLLGRVTHGQTASALEPAALMAWGTAEIEAHVEQEPKLGVALIQMMVQRCLDFEERLRSLAVEKTNERVARSLLQFAERLGSLTPDGSTHIPPLTHQVLSEYVGTSREIVTSQMNHLRQLGLLEYSRQGINIRVEALKNYLSGAVS